MEFPHLQKIYARYGGDDFTIFSVETTNRPELSKEFVQEFGATFPVVVDTARAAREAYELIGVPSSFVIDREGRYIFRHLGFSEGDEVMIEDEIRLLMDMGAGEPGGVTAS